MLQIIGWLGCVYLIVKAFEIASSADHRDENGFLKPFAVAATWVAVIAAGGFALWFYLQASNAVAQSESDVLSQRIYEGCLQFRPPSECATP